MRLIITAVVAVIAVVALLLFSGLIETGETADAASQGVAQAEGGAAATDDGAGARTIPAVTVAVAKTAAVEARVPVVGSLVARQNVQVYPQVNGYEITELLAEAGDRVEKGQVLARLSSDKLTAQLAQARAEYQRSEAGLKQAVTALDRVRSLRSSNNASQATLDDAIAAEANAQAALAQADAALSIAQLDLNRAQIVAPVAGLVQERNAMLGTLSGSAGEPLFSLVADGAVELAADIIETALGNLKIGNPAVITVAGVGEVTGKLRLIPAKIDPVTRLGSARISLDDQDALRTGLFASGWIITEKREAITVPAAAVLTDNGAERVNVVENGVVRTRQVKAGLIWDDLREITEGLQAGEKVIARSGAFFRDGDKVAEVVSTSGDPADPPEKGAAP